MASSDEGGRAGVFWAGAGAALQSAGLAAAAACGQFQATIHQGRSTKLHLGVDQKVDPDDNLPRAWGPVYGTSTVLTSLGMCVNTLVAGSPLRFGGATIEFSEGSPAALVLTVRFLPHEGKELNQLLDNGQD